MKKYLLGALLVISACTKTPEIEEKTGNEVKPVDIGSTPAKAGEVTIVGTKSKMIMQHPVSPPFGEPEPQMWYLDINGEEGRQVVVYSKEEPNCPDKIEVVATPRGVDASKGGGEIHFTQYDSSSWKCL